MNQKSKPYAFLLLFILQIAVPSQAQEERKQQNEQEETSETESEYLPDVSDLVALHQKGFQIQLANLMTIEEEEEINTKDESILVPIVIARFAFNDHWGLQSNLAYSISNFLIEDEVVSRDDMFKPFKIGAVYELDEDKGFWIFDQFTFNLDNEIPVNDDQEFGSILSTNWSTLLTKNERAELDYVFGTGVFEEGRWVGKYNFELDYYLSKAILLEIGNDGDWNWTGDDRDFETNLAFDLAFLSKYQYQFNLRYKRGLNHEMNQFGFSMILTFDKNRVEN